MKSFRDSTVSQHDYVFTFHPHEGTQIRQLPCMNGYLRSIRLSTEGTFDRVRLEDINGTSIVNASPAALAAVNGGDPQYIPLEFGADGFCTLPDLYAPHSYRLSLTGLTEECDVYVSYYTLPALRDTDGKPQAQTPPKVGTIACINEIADLPGDWGTHSQMHRIGNRIAYLGLLTPPRTIRFQHDTFIREITREMPALTIHDAPTLGHCLPTVQATLLQAHDIRPAIPRSELARWVVRDIC